MADTDAIVHTVKTVFDEYGFTWEADGYNSDVYDIQAHYLDLGHSFWVAEVDGRVVGTAALDRFPLLAGDFGGTVEHGGITRAAASDCSLERMYVHPAARRQGVGRGLFLFVCQTAISEGRQCLEMWSDQKLVDAHRMYQARGAVIVGERICHDPDKSREWGLALRFSDLRSQ